MLTFDHCNDFGGSDNNSSVEFWQDLFWGAIILCYEVTSYACRMTINVHYVTSTSCGRNECQRLDVAAAGTNRFGLDFVFTQSFTFRLYATSFTVFIFGT